MTLRRDGEEQIFYDQLESKQPFSTFYKKTIQSRFQDPDNLQFTLRPHFSSHQSHQGKNNFGSIKPERNSEIKTQAKKLKNHDFTSYDRTPLTERTLNCKGNLNFQQENTREDFLAYREPEQLRKGNHYKDHLANYKALQKYNESQSRQTTRKTHRRFFSALEISDRVISPNNFQYLENICFELEKRSENQKQKQNEGSKINEQPFSKFDRDIDPSPIKVKNPFFELKSPSITSQNSKELWLQAYLEGCAQRMKNIESKDMNKKNSSQIIEESGEDSEQFSESQKKQKEYQKNSFFSKSRKQKQNTKKSKVSLKNGTQKKMKIMDEKSEKAIRRIKNRIKVSCASYNEVEGRNDANFLNMRYQIEAKSRSQIIKNITDLNYFAKKKSQKF